MLEGGYLSVMGTGFSSLNISGTLSGDSDLAPCALRATGMQIRTKHAHLQDCPIHLIGSVVHLSGSMPVTLSPVAEAIQGDAASLLEMTAGEWRKNELILSCVCGGEACKLFLWVSRRKHTYV